MEDIFSTKERIKILKAIVFTKESISVNKIANQLKLSKGLVSKYLDLLVKQGIAKRTNGKFLINDSALVKGIRILLNLWNININIFKKYQFVKSVGLYGSCAKGENSDESDVDLWIKIDEIDEEKLASLSSELRKRIKNVKILFLTNEKIEKMKKEDPMFYHSLVFGSITIYGDKYGIQLQ